MIIDGKSVAITLIIVLAGSIYGLKFIRKFALQIAQENHDAVTAMDQEEEQQRLKKERDADRAADVAFAQVEPILRLDVPKLNVPVASPPSTGNSIPSQKKESLVVPVDENDDGVV